MATKAKHAERVEFHDESELWLRPLTIKHLRVFMAKLDEVRTNLSKEADEEGEIEIDELGMLGHFIDIALYCVNSQRGDKEELTTEQFEDMVDMPTIQDIMRICGGVEVGNPATATATQSQLGRR